MADAVSWPADKVERRSLAELLPHAKNARTHSDAQVEQIAASITEWGWTVPVLVDEAGVIIAGHGRVLAAKLLGLIEVPVMTAAGWSDERKRAYMLADNKLAMNAGWDNDLLKAELGHLGGLDFDIGLTGFSAKETRAMFAGDGFTDPDDVPTLPTIPTSTRGDIWLLGEHRLLCGSATDETDIALVLAGDQADLCLTDPPYGLGKGKASGKNAYREYDDTRENLIALARDWLPAARKAAKVVVFSPGVTNQWLYPEPNWMLCWFYGGGQMHSPWGRNCWQPFLCYGKDPSLTAGRGGRPDAVDLDVPPDAVSMNTPANAAGLDHPCPKPVKLWVWMLDRLAFRDGALVLDPFCGSGTTIIAAEMTTRRCAGIELDPAYVDVAVRRWEDFTGRVATLEATGQTFRQVAEERAEKAKAA